MGLRNYIWKKIWKESFQTKITLHISMKKDYPILYNKERNIAFAQ